MDFDREDIDNEEMEDSFPERSIKNLRNPSRSALDGGHPRPQGGFSYRDTLQRNNPELSFNKIQNAVWDDTLHGKESGDDEPPEEDDPTCPTITLIAMDN